MSSSWPQFELADPGCLAALAVLPVLAWYFRRSLVDFARWQRLLSLAARAVIVVLLALALAGLTLLKPTQELYVIAAVDRSLSIGEDQKAGEYLRQLETLRGANQLVVIPFAEKPGEPLADMTASLPPADGKGRHLAAALEAADGAMPQAFEQQIVLLSDGNQTSADALKAALRAEIPIATVPLATRSDPEVQLSGVKAPAQVREGEPFYLEVLIDVNHEDEGLLEIYRGA